ncbi:MAG: AmmeMemoRadiSam system protein B [Phycisphaerae bacterium]|nr:AmmeMemoRadiSam system protein B [Phycisphaerae bacterium]
MMIREAARAGSFYPAEPDACREELLRCLPDPASLGELPARIVGGIVPHAGWIYSGAVAARTFAAIAARRRPETVVVFGAVHRAMRADAAVFARGAWASPLGEIAIDERLAERLLGACSFVRDEPYAHESEHSIEVQVPFIQHFFPQAKCLPVSVMPGPRASEIGLAAAGVVRDSGVDAVFIGSTDLTHYGPSYGSVSHGIGTEGLRWAREENDRRMLDLILARDADAIVAEAKAHHNACGSGAVAACIVAANELGATRARLLEHTTSAEVGARFGMGGGADAVGYAAVVFGSDE